MLAHNKEALIADFAETYHIYNYKQFPATYTAMLAAQLSPNSRVKRSYLGVDASDDYLLQTLIFDRLNLLLWLQTEDGGKGTNRPVSLYEKLTNKLDVEDAQGFDTSEEFDERRKEILSTLKKGGRDIG